MHQDSPPNQNDRGPRFRLHSLLIFVAVACLILGIVGYLRSPSYEERLLFERQREFFLFADSVFADTPGFKASSLERGHRGELADYVRRFGGQFYGSQGLTLESSDGIKFQVWLAKFSALPFRLERNQKYSAPIYFVHDPYTDLKCFWNGELFTRAAADEVLQINAGSTTIPVQYVKWPMPHGAFRHSYYTWYADGSWMLPITSGKERSYRIPNLQPHALENGWEVLRVRITPINAVGDEAAPVSSIKAILDLI